eukprot:749015-Hanusia_phi.AAC.5
MMLRIVPYGGGPPTVTAGRPRQPESRTGRPGNAARSSQLGSRDSESLSQRVGARPEQSRAAAAPGLRAPGTVTHGGTGRGSPAQPQWQAGRCSVLQCTESERIRPS